MLYCVLTCMWLWYVYRKELIVRAVHGTLIIFLQNDAGFAKWGPTPERVKELQKAYTLKDPPGNWWELGTNSWLVISIYCVLVFASVGCLLWHLGSNWLLIGKNNDATHWGIDSGVTWSVDMYWCSQKWLLVVKVVIDVLVQTYWSYHQILQHLPWPISTSCHRSLWLANNIYGNFGMMIYK